MPFSLPIGMGCTLVGLVLLATAGHYSMILLSVALIGLGSSIFHPDPRASPAWPRAAGMASRSRCSRSEAISARPSGRCSPPSSCCRAGRRRRLVRARRTRRHHHPVAESVSGIGRSIAPASARRSQPSPIVVLPRQGGDPLDHHPGAADLLKFFYMAALSSYYTFYLIDTFGVSVQRSQLLLFVFLGAVALGTFAGGPIGDRFGRKYVIWFSILGVLPFTLALPHANLAWTVTLSVDHRPRPVLGLLGDHRLCAGADPRQGRHRLRPVLRLRLRHGRHRRRGAR